jgi:ABC-2 type transport system ATP-binding protein
MAFLMSELSIQCSGLTKSYRTYSREAGIWGSVKSLFHREYKDVIALAPFDLEIHKGEIVGLLGANGAGKTTCMKMLSGIIMPSGGEVMVGGHRPGKRENAFKRKIALVMGQKAQLWWDLPASDSYQLLREIYEIPKADFDARLDKLSSLLDVQRLLGIQIRRLSLGERMKMEIIACLLHQPEVVLLDEPTIGLDINAQETIREFFQQYQEEHEATIILTSHYMADVQALCPRVVLLVAGHKRYDGPIKTIAEKLGSTKSLVLHFNEDVARDHTFLEAFETEWHGEHEVELVVPRETLASVANRALQELPVCDFNTAEVPFEKVVGALMDNPELLNE